MRRLLQRNLNRAQHTWQHVREKFWLWYWRGVDPICVGCGVRLHWQQRFRVKPIMLPIGALPLSEGLLVDAYQLAYALCNPDVGGKAFKDQQQMRYDESKKFWDDVEDINKELVRKHSKYGVYDMPDWRMKVFE